MSSAAPIDPATPVVPAANLPNRVALRCSGLHRYLGHDEGRVHVLKGVSFEAERGKVYAIVGPSRPSAPISRKTPGSAVSWRNASSTRELSLSWQ